MVMYRTGTAEQLGWDSATLSGAHSAAGSGTALPPPTSMKTTTEGGRPCQPHPPPPCRRRRRQQRQRQWQQQLTGATTVLVPHGIKLPLPLPFTTADLPASPANAPTHVPSNATDAPTHTSLSLVKDRGTTARTTSLLLAATAAPVGTSTAVTNAPSPTMVTPTMTTPLMMTMPSTTSTTSFVKLNFI